MKKRILLASFSSLAFLFCLSQKTDRKLEKQITESIQGFNGVIGIYIKNLRTGHVVSINADTLFPTASIVKVPILYGVINRIERGELSYNQELVYKDSLLYAGSDILGSLKSGEKILLKKVIMQISGGKWEHTSWNMSEININYQPGH